MTDAPPRTTTVRTLLDAVREVTTSGRIITIEVPQREAARLRA
jgi:hypothetical protein